jgi:hypothetical protein
MLLASQIAAEITAAKKMRELTIAETEVVGAGVAGPVRPPWIWIPLPTPLPPIGPISIPTPFPIDPCPTIEPIDG